LTNPEPEVAPKVGDTWRNLGISKMTLSEISRRYDIRFKKLRRMERDGVLNCDPDELPGDPTLSKMLRYVRSRGGFTAPQLVSLIEEPSLLDSLGCHADKARKQLAKLGDPIEPAPMEVSFAVTFAAMGEMDSVLPIVRWCKTVIPSDGAVTHHYLAVRLLLGTPKNIRHFDEPRMQRTMLNCRQHPEFSEWWHVEKQGSRNVTLYHRPKIDFDL
jgi:hypothetical protein